MIQATQAATGVYSVNFDSVTEHHVKGLISDDFQRVSLLVLSFLISRGCLSIAGVS